MKMSVFEVLKLSGPSGQTFPRDRTGAVVSKSYFECRFVWPVEWSAVFIQRTAHSPPELKAENSSFVQSRRL